MHYQDEDSGASWWNRGWSLRDRSPVAWRQWQQPAEKSYRQRFKVMIGLQREDKAVAANVRNESFAEYDPDSPYAV